MRIQLASVIVGDQDRALKFYTEVLGFVKKLSPSRTSRRSTNA